MLLDKGIQYCELWTQEDEAANRFYQSVGFELDGENTWIRYHLRWDNCSKLLNWERTGDVYGVEELVFQASLQRKEELKAICDRIDEVRLYAKKLGWRCGYESKTYDCGEQMQGRILQNRG